MIYKQCTITIAKNGATLDEDIYLYRLDKNIELHFTIVNNKYKFDKSDLNNIIAQTQAAYFQVRLYKNADIKYTFAIQPTDNGKAILKITDDLIDDPIEVGEYDFQISLLDADKTSMISMPIVTKQLHVCEPLVSDTALMGKAVLGLSTAANGEIKNAFDSQGNYIREIHNDGEIISASTFNKFEEALETNTKAIKAGTGSAYDDTAIKADIQTLKTNQVNLVEDETSMEGIKDNEYPTLTTTNKTLIGSINELNTQYKDIVNKIENGGGGSTDANGISIQDIANNFTSTNVEGALAELFQFINTVAEKVKQIDSDEQLLYTFGLLSDVHVDGDGNDEAFSNSDLKNAISFLEKAGASFIAYAGDMTYNGRAEDYTALKTCLQTATIPNYCVRGNHDAYSLADGYASATGCKEDYIITQNNDLLIFISCADTNHDTGGLTTAKLDWLENLLKNNTNTRVFLFYHYFVDGTSGNGTGVYPYGTLKPSNAVALRFINMVKQYPNLIYCNGHSHMRFNIQDKDPNANYYHNDGECYYIHIPSTSKPRFPSGDTVADYYEGSEGYLVKVYANKVLFKPIDFIAKQYLTAYNYTANVAQGNAPTVPTNTIDITWNDGIKIDKSTGTETADNNYSASNFIACDPTKTYTLNLASSMATYNGNVYICYYNESKSFISCSDNFIGIHNGSTENFTAELSLPTNAKYIKLRFYATNVSAIDKSIITLTTK